MHNLIYVSSASRLFSNNELIDILQTCQTNNARLDVTGLLLYNEGSVMQILEGEEAVVHELFDTICMDSRHTGIIKMIDFSVPERSFQDWSMGFKQITNEDWSALSGYLNLDNRDQFNQSAYSGPTHIITMIKSFVNVNMNISDSIKFTKHRIGIPYK